MADGFRIVENGVDSRIDEALNTRVTEGFTASGNGAVLTGEGSLVVTPRATYKMSASLVATGTLVTTPRSGLSSTVSLTGVGTLTASPSVIPFSSIIHVNVAGVWKTATLFVKNNGIWAAPMSQSYKVGHAWTRVY